MALPYVFNNTVYGAGFVGSDDGAPAASFGIDDRSTADITVNGTINNPGDPVTLSGILPGETTSSTITVFATSFDSPSQLQLTDSLNNPTTRYVLTDTQFVASPRGRFASDGDTALGAYAVPVCFTSGTRIRTAHGEVAVEDLRVGDLAVTSSGEHRPIRWIGHRTLNCLEHGDPADILPVRIAAGALGPNRPVRDLTVSPGHAICLDVLGEVLVPASALINGTTITYQQVSTVTYWHVELDRHDILLAEGQPAESYLDVGNRSFFAQSDLVALRGRPDAPASATADAPYCRPFHKSGALVDAVRAQLRNRARALGWRLDGTTWAEAHLMVDGRRITGTMRGLTALFAVPASAKTVVLMSQTCAPSEIEQSGDTRRLGLSLKGITIIDDLGAKRAVALNDPALDEGFHDLEGVSRWTSDRAVFPASLFAGCQGTVFLRLDLAVPALPRWTAPDAAGLSPTAAAA